MQSKFWYIFGILLIGVLVVWGIVVGLSSGVSVDTAEVTVGPIRQFVDERAVTRLPETFLITMPIDGRIEPITLVEGTPVAKGQTVAQIVAEDLQLNVDHATAAVERLEASIYETEDTSVEETAYEQAIKFVDSMAATVQVAMSRVEAGKDKYAYAEKDFGRIAGLGPNARTQDQMDQADLRKKQAAHALQEDMLVHAGMVAMKAATNLLPTMVRQFIRRKTERTAEVLKKQKAEAEVRLEQVKQDQRRGSMTSPVEGVVLERFVSNERFLAAGTKLLEIGRLEDLQIETDVLSLDVVDAKVGSRVKIYGPAIGEKPAYGTVANKYPSGFTKISSLGVEQQRVKVIIDFDEGELQRLSQQEQRELGVGYRVRVQITTAEKNDALTLPRPALFRGTNGKWQVYVVENGRARIRSVDIGMINDQLAEITAGLEAGDQVVVAPESNLTDGARVQPADSP
ncbi:MAG TPA: efflux RND transporter periplasmic adaptor subunit [Thermoguttaceae bacterium]|nr:efflux RND transporter periplasmic adaptor subunit [Thermoguttaceae bacterium]